MEEIENVEAMDRRKLIKLLRRQEEELKESQARFDGLARTASATVFLVSGDGDLECFTDPPEKFPCHGRSRQPAGHITRIIHPEDLPAVEAHLREIMDGTAPAGEGVVCRIAGDHSKWIKAKATAVHSGDGSLKYFLGLARDISEEKKQEEALKSATQTAELCRQRIERLTRDISSSLSTFYEDARSSLEIVNSQGAALDTSAAGAVERAREALAMLGTSMSQIISSAAREDQLSPLRPVFMDAGYLIDVVIKTIRSEAEGKGVALKNMVPPQTRILADPVQIQKALGGLAGMVMDMCGGEGNLEFYAPPGRNGAITLRAPMPKGANADELASSFCPVETIISRLDGKLTTRSQDGALEFYVSLPYRPPLAVLADDDENLLFLMKTYMDLIGVDVLEASDGKQALELARTRKPDIVITDYMMPVMDGLGLLCAMRDNPATARTPVIIITSAQEARLREKLFLHGADDLLQKPLTERELIPRIRRFIA